MKNVWNEILEIIFFIFWYIENWCIPIMHLCHNIRTNYWEMITFNDTYRQCVKTRQNTLWQCASQFNQVEDLLDNRDNRLNQARRDQIWPNYIYSIYARLDLSPYNLRRQKIKIVTFLLQKQCWQCHWDCLATLDMSHPITRQ